MAAKKTQTKKSSASSAKSRAQTNSKSKKGSTTRKSSSASRPKSSTKPKSSSTRRSKKKASRPSRMAIGCMIVVSWVLGIIILLSLGIVGTILNEVFQLLIGNFLYVLIPVIMVIGFLYIWNQAQKPYTYRSMMGFILFGLFWVLAAGLFATPDGDPWAALSTLQNSLPDFGVQAFHSAYGLIGAVLAGLFSSLFSKTGAWLFDAGLLVISIALMFWNYIALAMLSRENKPKKQKEKKPIQAELRQEVIPADPDGGRESARSKFRSWFLVDEDEDPGETISSKMRRFMDLKVDPEPGMVTVKEPDYSPFPVDEPMEPAVDPDLLVQESLPGFSIPQADEVAQASQKSQSKADIHFGPNKGATSQNHAAGAGPSAAGSSASGSENGQTGPVMGTIGSNGVFNGNTNGTAIRTGAGAHPAGSTGAGPEESLSGPAKTIDGVPVYNPATYKLPPISLLEESKTKGRSSTNIRNARSQGVRLIEILKEFNVDAQLGDIHIGPSVTEFEVIPGQGVRVNTFTNLSNDIKMALAAKDIRVEAPIPGKSAVGIEVPNAEKTAVTMKELIRSVPPSLADKPLVFTLGKDLMGNSVYGRLDTMPHLLIAGATGSGKSVCVNSIICSLLLRTKPDEVKLLLIDPKKVEFTPYNGIPHLLGPVITDANLASGALKVIVEMMDQRYSLFEELSVRNISSYNEYVRRNPSCNKLPLPRIVVIIDELADLMLAASKDVEQSIQRITQLARAAGIHLIVATQRPSVNVITGVIKANIPSRIAFMVSSRPDSRTILDQIGAEKLLGYGDMLFLDNGAASPVRLQGVFIQDKEVEQICSFVKSQAAPDYEDAFVMLKEINSQGGEVSEMAEETDPLYPEVKNFVIVSRKASTSLIQRRFRLGYGRAARILDQLEAGGIIGPANGTRPREILVEAPGDEFDGM